MNIVLLGAQGAGKGIVSDYLSQKYNFKHISTGELFREEVKSNSPLGNKLAEYMNKGLLVPDEIVFSILEKALGDSCNCIIDGFPRNMAQAEKLDSLTNVDLVIYVDAPKDILIDRLTARRFCPKCKGNYNLLFYKSNTCEKCNETLLQRDDDKIDAINKRLEIFYGNINPILNFYKDKNILKTLENSGDLTQTYNNLEKIIKEILWFVEQKKIMKVWN